MKMKSILALYGLIFLLPSNSFAQIKSVQIELNGVPGAKVVDYGGYGGVFLEGTSIDISRIKSLKKFKGIELISLKGEKVTDDILEEVAKIPGLKGIGIFDSNISDDGLKHLADCKSLERIGISKPRITDIGVSYLAKLTRLKDLDIVGAKQVTDQSIAELTSKCAFLESLNLFGTGITDQSLKNIEKLPSLKFLAVYETKVTKTQVEKLKKVFPKAEIRGD